ncbi:MAG: aldehyde dehydrogenase family protein [Candidatus Sericytochromatia bacterium]
MSLIIDRSEYKTATQIESVNPATLEKLGVVPVFNEEQVKEAVAKAKNAFLTWSNSSWEERAKYLIKAKDYILKNLDSIAEVITKENGKPLVEAITAEILPVLELISHYAKNKDEIITKEEINLGKWALMQKSSYLEYKPLGVIGIISPWNYPFSIPAGQIFTALITGNTIVLKPSEHTSLIGLEIEKILKAINLPEGVFNIVTGFGETGGFLVKSGVNKIVFTGSVATGKRIMAAASENLTPVVLELGGKDPMIVFDDINMDIVSSGAVWGAFTNSGQVCASVERLYVHENIADEFIYEVAKKTKALKQGNGLDKNNDLGPMISLEQMGIVENHIQDAISKGAKIITGGNRQEGSEGFFFKPTILTNVDHSFKIVSDETFGPILPIMTFKKEEEVIKLANDSKYALTASVWSNNISKAKNLATKIEAGTVSVNDCISSFALCQTPWGGPKESGIGRTHSKLGVLEFLEPKHIHIDKNNIIKKFWWFGYDENRFEMMKKSLHVLYNTKDSIKQVPDLVKDFMKNKVL